MFCNDCKKEWGNHCRNYISDIIKSKSLETYLDKYKDMGIISGKKDDRVLINHLCDNGFLKNNDTCYLRLACNLFQNEDNREQVKFFIYYLKESFGYPFDENNILLENVRNDYIVPKCFCNMHNRERKRCHKYIREIMREDGTLYNKNDELYLEMLKDYISMKKNDKVLLGFIKENYEKYKMCYYDIAVFIMWEIFDDFDIHMRKDIIIFMISYLYWSYGSTLDDNNILKTYFEDKWIENVSIMHEEFDKMKTLKNKVPRKEKSSIRIFKNKTIKVLVNKRITQTFFRKRLINKYGCCQICGMDIVGLLRASHSKPFKDCSIKEAKDIYNGLLLCSGHDSVYDGGYISFNDDGSIILSKYLSEENKKRFNITNDIKIELEPEHSEYLEYHRNSVFRK